VGRRIVLGSCFVLGALRAFVACDTEIPRGDGPPRYYIPPDADDEDVYVPSVTIYPDAAADVAIPDAALDADAAVPAVPTLATGASFHPDPAVGNGDHTCVAIPDAGVFCWGANDHGQLGIGTNVDAPSAVKVATDENGLALGDVDELALAGWHSCARRGEDLFCWGQRFTAAQAEPPSAANADRTQPRAIGNLQIAHVAAGGPHTCAVETNGRHVCFGHASLGELGAPDAAVPCTAPIFYAYAGETTPTCSASLVPREPALPGLASIAAGEVHSCALANGRVVCWGSNADRQAPATVLLDATTQLEGVQALASGGHRNCAIAQGKVFCWGDGANPAAVPGITNPLAIGVGEGIACAIGADHKASCWTGPLGDAGAPTLIALDDVIAVAPGLSHACAMKKSHEVFCWGKNNRGQLGDGTKVDSAVPVKVTGLPL
jgi:alpha-tubulin suppressor-like RCC1 family protein